MCFFMLKSTSIGKDKKKNPNIANHKTEKFINLITINFTLFFSYKIYGMIMEFQSPKYILFLLIILQFECVLPLFFFLF